jgi:hypothetical protein
MSTPAAQALPVEPVQMEAVDLLWHERAIRDRHGTAISIFSTGSLSSTA